MNRILKRFPIITIITWTEVYHGDFILIKRNSACRTKRPKYQSQGEMGIILSKSCFDMTLLGKNIMTIKRSKKLARILLFFSISQWYRAKSLVIFSYILVCIKGMPWQCSGPIGLLFPGFKFGLLGTIMWSLGFRAHFRGLHLIYLESPSHVFITSVRGCLSHLRVLI